MRRIQEFDYDAHIDRLLLGSAPWGIRVRYRIRGARLWTKFVLVPGTTPESELTETFVQVCEKIEPAILAHHESQLGG